MTRAERAEIVRLYKSGIASLAVAERMKLSKSCVLGILRAEGVVMRPQGTRSASVSLASWTGEDSWVSRFVGEIRRARAEGRLGGALSGCGCTPSLPRLGKPHLQRVSTQAPRKKPRRQHGLLPAERRRELQLAQLTTVRR